MRETETRGKTTVNGVIREREREISAIAAATICIWSIRYSASNTIPETALSVTQRSLVRITRLADYIDPVLETCIF